MMDRILTYFDGIAVLRGWPRARRAGALILIMWLPSLLINWLVLRYLPTNEIGSGIGSLSQILLGITFLPLAETYGVRFGLFVLRKLSENTLFVCVISAVGWGFLHAFRYWGLYAVWPFFVMSYCYLRLERKSVTEAMVVSTLLHGGANAFATIVALIGNHYLPNLR